MIAVLPSREKVESVRLARVMGVEEWTEVGTVILTAGSVRALEPGEEELRKRGEAENAREARRRMGRGALGRAERRAVGRNIVVDAVVVVRVMVIIGKVES